MQAMLSIKFFGNKECRGIDTFFIIWEYLNICIGALWIYSEISKDSNFIT